MLLIQNLGLHFAGNYLFSNVNFKINARDKIGLAGKNGAGKSTLLKILSGELSQYEGSISQEGKISIGFLKQDLDFAKGETVWDEAQKAFKELNALEEEQKAIENQLNTRTDYESESYLGLIERLTFITDRFTHLDGYQKDAETEKVLKGLGFQSSDFQKITDTFSGGWRMRIELAKLLLQKHDVLLLDEPTNHLDIDSIMWLEEYLQDFSGAVVLVSHDLEFLSNLTNRTLEISNKSIQDYKANYEKYLVLRQERKEKLLQTQKNQEQQIKHTEQLIEKFRYKASKASMAQSLIKKLDKIERVEIEEEDVSQFNIRFESSIRPGKVIFKAEDLGKSYGDKEVFSGANFYIERGKKYAFVGQNGQGKTTLAKILAEVEKKSEGDLERGHNVQIGYFAQNQEEVLTGENTVLQEAENAATEETRKKVRGLLGSFLFSGETVDKKVKVLSGGERNRLALCKLLLQPFNTLILDEPTNHLDIHSKEIIKNALKQFDGTIILVSHDRQFLEDLSEIVYEFKEGQIKEYLGTIQEYLSYRKAENLKQLEKPTEVNTKEKVEQVQEELDFEAQKIRKKLENKLSRVESEITKWEREKSRLEEQFLTQNPSEEELNNFQELKNKIESLTKEWEELAMELET